MASSKITVGDVAPDFDLPGTGGIRYKLSDYRGRPVILVFYPGDNSPVCTLQLKSYSSDFTMFEKANAQVLAISQQSVSSHEGFCSKHNFPFPLLADEGKLVAEAYGTVGPLGFARRSVFAIDSEGVVRWVWRGLTGATYKTAADIVAGLDSSGT